MRGLTHPVWRTHHRSGGIDGDTLARRATVHRLPATEPGLQVLLFQEQQVYGAHPAAASELQLNAVDPCASQPYRTDAGTVEKPAGSAISCVPRHVPTGVCLHRNRKTRELA
jgi:hypothetical protein